MNLKGGIAFTNPLSEILEIFNSELIRGKMKKI